jgi:hypothetical protein
MTEDRNLWMSDGHGTWKIYHNLDGKMLYSWGTWGPDLASSRSA